MPATEQILCLFATHLAASNSHKSIKTALAAVRSHHIDVGHHLETEKMLRLKRVCDGIRKSRCNVAAKERLPITIEVLERLAAVCALSQHEDIMFFAICCIGTYGLLRSGEIFGVPPEFEGLVKNSDIIRSENHVKIQLRVSKTDPFRKGTQVLVYRNQSITCPVAAVSKYLRCTRNITKSAPFFQLQNRNPVTKPWFIRKLRQKLMAAGLDERKYSGHSFRRGGATSMAAAGIPDSIIKEAGRWSSNSYQVYVQPSNKSAESISQVLGNHRFWGEKPLSGFGGIVPAHPSPKMVQPTVLVRRVTPKQQMSGFQQKCGGQVCCNWSRRT